MPFTGERFTPETHGNIELEHLHRYALACELAAGRTILDIACGEGYGSAMLAKKAKKVIGVDISEETIRHANKRYKKQNIEFKVGSCSDIPLPDGSVDYVVSFETIEHHDQHEQMMKEIKRVLRPNGILLISSPDKGNYNDKLGYDNEFHVKELNENEFKRLINKYFKRSAYFGQRVLFGSGIFADSISTKAKVFKQNKRSSISNYKGMLDPIYWIAIASDAQIPILPSGIFEQPVDGSDYARTLTDQLNATTAGFMAAIRDKDSRIATLDGSGKLLNDRNGRTIIALSAAILKSYIIMRGIIREYLDLTAIFIKGSFVFNVNRLSKFPEGFGFCGCLDTPRKNEYCSMCSGWFVSKKPINKAELFIGDKKITELERNITRRDVDIAVRGYDHIVKKGFQFHIPELILADLNNKERTLFIRFYVDNIHYVDKFRTKVRFGILSPDAEERPLKNITTEHQRGGNDNVKRILLVSQYCPSRYHAGGLRILDIYSFLRKNLKDVRLELFTAKRPKVDKSYSGLNKVFHKVYFAKKEGLTFKEFAKLRGAPMDYDVIDFQFLDAAEDIDKFKRIAKKVLFTPMELLLRSGLIIRDWKMIRRYGLEELRLARKADITVCVSDMDSRILKMFAWGQNIMSLPTGLSPFEFNNELSRDHRPIKAKDKKLTVLYLAYFGSMTNVIALKWYLENIHPKILEKVPGYEFLILGSGDLSKFSKYENKNVKIIGAVDKIAPYLNKAKVGIAPALNGAGFRGKINQYALCGLPCVATPLSARGLAYENGKDIFIEGQPELFAQKIISLLLDNGLNRKISSSARKVCLKNYTWEARKADIYGIYGIPS